LIVSQSILARFAAPMAPGAKAAAATPNRASAYKLESTPGSAMTSFAAAKLLAHKAHRIKMTPLHARGSSQPMVAPPSATWVGPDCDSCNFPNSGAIALIAKGEFVAFRFTNNSSFVEADLRRRVCWLDLVSNLEFIILPSKVPHDLGHVANASTTRMQTPRRSNELLDAAAQRTKERFIIITMAFDTR
jgi:hypothetical protein